ncbi:uncharacterized protein [Montipora capricornis]|uniref:uncharacterized protein isoform X1 n=2 Tax=Montipora foliosa TaxID=591990 RepID=UPI0035F14DD2
MSTVRKDSQETVQEMKVISSKLVENNGLDEENSLGQADRFYDNLSFPLRQKDVVSSPTPASFPYTAQLSRSYVQQVSSVAWPQIKHVRLRSNSFPFIRRWSPLPRVLEEDESLDEAPSSGTIPCVSQVSVQKVNWADDNLSQEWLCKINSLRSTLVLTADCPTTKLKKFRPRSHSFPFVKGPSSLPCVAEEEEIIGDENPKMANLQISQQQQQQHPFSLNDNKFPQNILLRINSLRRTLSKKDHCPEPQGSYKLERPPTETVISHKLLDGLDFSQRSNVTDFERNAGHVGKKIEQAKISHIRKPDSTYISLISGFTHEKSKQTGAQSRGADPEMQSGKNCKKLKCIAFSPSKLFCSSARYGKNLRQQISNSSEYIPHMGC